MEITIQGAMNQLNLIEKKINKSLENSFVNYYVGSKPVHGFKNNNEYEDKVKSTLQSIQDLIKRRDEIKNAIVASNAKTKIRVGNIEYTVAHALELKGSPNRIGGLHYKKNLLNKLVKDLYSANGSIERENNRLEQEISQKADIMLGKDSIKADPTQIDEIRKLLSAQKEAKIIDPINIQKIIDEMSEEIDEFEANIDAAISESNAITRVSISGPESNA